MKNYTFFIFNPILLDPPDCRRSFQWLTLQNTDSFKILRFTFMAQKKKKSKYYPEEFFFISPLCSGDGPAICPAWPQGC
jgi:hypothetical protein